MNKVLEEISSEPTIALILMLAVVLSLVLIGKLSSEAVDALKWIAGTYFGMHGFSNLMPNKPQ